MLIRTFEVQIRRPFERIGVRAAQHVKMRRTRVKPHVQRVFVFHVIDRIATQKFIDVQRLPRFDTVRLDQLRHTLEQLRRIRVQLSRRLVQEKRHRHAPLALTRQRPVGTIGNHRVQTCFTPRWEKLSCFHAFECGFAQALAIHRFVHRGKPLRSRTVDQWRFVTPAVHIAVVVFDHFEQGADLL